MTIEEIDQQIATVEQNQRDVLSWTARRQEDARTLEQRRRTDPTLTQFIYDGLKSDIDADLRLLRHGYGNRAMNSDPGASPEVGAFMWNGGNRRLGYEECIVRLRRLVEERDALIAEREFDPSKPVRARLRPGFVHGFLNAGDEIELTAAQARAFADKFEVVEEVATS